jgi:hypothetical protein
MCHFIHECVFRDPSGSDSSGSCESWPRINDVGKTLVLMGLKLCVVSELFERCSCISEFAQHRPQVG